MPKYDIEESERICAAATPGPWVAESEHTIRSVVTNRKVATAHRWDNCEQDSAFIAHARTALPAALDELRELRAENKRLRGAILGHKQASWGEGLVNNSFDHDLYAALNDAPDKEASHADES